MALTIRDEITKILNSGGFNVHQWASNDPRILEGLNPDQVNAKLDLNKDGLSGKWQNQSAKVTYVLPLYTGHTLITVHYTVFSFYP